MSAREQAALVVEDGRVFRGEAYGALGATLGEVVFCTGMTGYQETLTDPSYHGQIVVQTAPQIGNTGWNDEDDESSRIWVSGYVVRDPARRPSNWRATRSLDDELTRQGVVGIAGVDTRTLTRHIREQGAMRAGVFSGAELSDVDTMLAKVKAAPQMKGADLAGDVTTANTYVVPADGERRFRVAALDLGIKSNTPRMMAARGIEVHVLPLTSTLDDLLAVEADGVFLSNGPGDPAGVAGAPEAIRGLLGEVPVFGICLGHQLLGLSLGGTTSKLPFGHHGANHPVRRISGGAVEITSQNHNYAVDAGSLDGAEVTHVNLNDGVVEGLRVERLRAFSVQYHPEAAPGPHDAAYLFDEFTALMRATSMRASR